MMTVINNVKELPDEPLRGFSVKDKAEAEKLAAEYKTSWFYQTALLKITYLYVPYLEWEAKQKVQS